MHVLQGMGSQKFEPIHPKICILRGVKKDVLRVATSSVLVRRTTDLVHCYSFIWSVIKQYEAFWHVYAYSPFQWTLSHIWGTDTFFWWHTSARADAGGLWSDMLCHRSTLKTTDQPVGVPGRDEITNHSCIWTLCHNRVPDRGIPWSEKLNKG